MREAVTGVQRTKSAVIIVYHEGQRVITQLGTALFRMPCFFTSWPLPHLLSEQSMTAYQSAAAVFSSKRFVSKARGFRVFGAQVFSHAASSVCMIEKRVKRTSAAVFRRLPFPAQFDFPCSVFGSTAVARHTSLAVLAAPERVRASEQLT